MNALSLLKSHGAVMSLSASGQIEMDLSQVPHEQRPEVVALAKQHKTAIINELTGGPTGSLVPLPSNLAEDLLCCGYYAPEWTPAGCRAFLAELQAEWPGFEVRGWHGLTMPECWPVRLMDAVTTTYVMSIQDQGAMPEEQ
ncbi:MAG: hypothetical protein Q7J24_06320 [Desulfomicrobium sp.]|nr:hypothetical protein [Desulfomicrobium sp.]